MRVRLRGLNSVTKRLADGSIVIVTGQGEQQQRNEVDEWIAKHARAPERH